MFNRVYAEGRLEHDARTTFACDLDALIFGPVQRVTGRWSGKTSAAGPGADRRYILTVADAGGVTGTFGSSAFDVIPGRRGMLFSPGVAFRLRLQLQPQTTFDERSLVFDEGLIHGHLRTLVGRDAPEPLRFEGPLLLDDGPGTVLSSVLSVFHQELDRADASPLLLLALRDAVLTGLLVTTRHTATRLLEAPPLRVAQGCVRRAEEFIAAHASEAITIADIVAAAGVPERSLRAAFKACVGRAPMEVLRHHRVELARRHLAAPGPGTTVARVVSSLGLGNPGRFSIEYRKRFGEAPSETLERGLAIAGLPRRRPR